MTALGLVRAHNILPLSLTLQAIHCASHLPTSHNPWACDVTQTFQTRTSSFPYTKHLHYFHQQFSQSLVKCHVC